MSEFPKMLYRAGGDQDCHGHPCATLVVETAEQQEAAFDEGYFLTPVEAHGGEAPPRPIVDASAASDEIEAMRDEIEGLKVEIEGLTGSVDAAQKEIKHVVEERDEAVSAHSRLTDALATKAAEVERLNKEIEQLKADLDAATAPKADSKPGKGDKTA